MPEATYVLSLDDFRQVNPNTETAPIYRAARDKVISSAIYDRLPILVDRSSGPEARALPVRYVRMFDMANDSKSFRDQTELEEAERAYPTRGNRWMSAKGEWVPLYEGKMVQAFDHRASSITMAAKNMYRPGQGIERSPSEHSDPSFFPKPRYFIHSWQPLKVQVALKDITSTTNARSIISCLIPAYGAGHTSGIPSF